MKNGRIRIRIKESLYELLRRCKLTLQLLSTLPPKPSVLLSRFPHRKLPTATGPPPPPPVHFPSMAYEQHHVPHNASEPYDELSVVMELSENDPLYVKKKKLLEVVGFHPDGLITFRSSSSLESLNSILDSVLQRARIIKADEVDLYFGVDDSFHLVGFSSTRNELEALHTTLSLIEKGISTYDQRGVNILQYLRNATINKIHAFGNKFKDETKVLPNSNSGREKSLLQWSESNGVRSKLEIAYVEGAGRGAIAREDLKVGDVALEIPVSLIISEELVRESDMFPVLQKIEDISSETILLLWSMKERCNCESKFKFYFDTLPETFNTGLSFGVEAIMALDGTLVLEEIVEAKEHLRSQYDELIPALCRGHPDIFPPELYTWEHFLWACELWYSNSMKVMFHDGLLRTCLIPIADNPTYYGRVDSTTNSLKFTLSRPCDAGKQCFLSYGNFSSSHLLTFYGFLPQEDNPYDVIPLDFYFPQLDSSEDELIWSDWSTHMVRGTWLSTKHKLFHYGLPAPLLKLLRRAKNPTPLTNNVNLQTKENLQIELEVLGDLRSAFAVMTETSDGTGYDARENCNWNVKLALKFKDLQRRILSSIITACDNGCKRVELELSKCVA